MQKCPTCKFRKVHIEQIRDDTGKVIIVQDVCSNCNVVLKEKILNKKRGFRKFWKK